MQRAAYHGLFLSTLLTACGGRETGETKPSYLYPAESDFCSALAKAECNKAVAKACYGSDDSTLAEDQANCAASRQLRCNPEGLPYHPELAEGCLAARRDGLADAVWTHVELDAVETACLPVFSKEGPDGAVCSVSTECDAAQGLLCIVKLGSIKGICGAPISVTGGEDCSDPVKVCSTGFYCDATMSSHCLALRKEGESCSAGSPCSADFYCTSPEDGVCTVKTKNGLDCVKGEVCAGGFCLGMTPNKAGVCSSTLPLQINAETCDPYR
jgi:hypothetical protein